MAWIGYVGPGFFSLIIAFLILKDLYIFGSYIFIKVIFIIQALTSRGLSEIGIQDPERRRFLINSFNFGILGLSAIAKGYGMYEAKKTLPKKNNSTY